MQLLKSTTRFQEMSIEPETTQKSVTQVATVLTKPSQDAFTAANLCERCKILQFHDKAVGGYTVGEEGTLMLNTDDEKLEPYSYLDESSKFYVPLDYFVEEVLPQLYVLKESYEQGCEFCGLLRHSIQQHYRDSTGPVEITLGFIWSNETGLMALEINLSGYNDNLYLPIDAPVG